MSCVGFDVLIQREPSLGLSAHMHDELQNLQNAAEDKLTSLKLAVIPIAMHRLSALMSTIPLSRGTS